jgi:pimeloyl-ACP methyl ester carboxylesterase
MENIILLHGIWMKSLVMKPLAARLRRDGFQTRCFSYPSVQNSPQANAIALNRFIQGVDAEKIHFVAHSLGGLVLMHFFHQFQFDIPGRVVMLGSPVSGSWGARRLLSFPGGHLFLGRSIEQGLLGETPQWESDREVGMVAGTIGIGLGKLLGKMPGVNDGAVMLSETEAPWLTDHVSIKTSHTGLLVSAEAARQAVNFLKYGHFSLEF